MAGDPVSGAVDSGIQVAGFVTNLINQMNANGANQAAIDQMLANLKSIPQPVLQQLAAQQVGPSQAGNVSTDPALAGDQYAGLGQLQSIIDGGGATLADRANFEQGQNQASQRVLAQRQAITNLLARQGQNPGATSAAMQLGAQRAQQQTSANVGLQNSANMQQRAYQAVLDRAKMAAGQQERQYSQGYQQGAARDAITQYNANARATANKYNASLPQQNYDNQVGMALNMNGALGAQIQNTNQSTAKTQQAVADGAAGLGSVAKGFGSTVQAGQQSSGGSTVPSTSYGEFSQAPTPLDEGGYY